MRCDDGVAEGALNRDGGDGGGGEEGLGERVAFGAGCGGVGGEEC